MNNNNKKKQEQNENYNMQNDIKCFKWKNKGKLL